MKGFINAKAYLHGIGISRVNIGIEDGRIAYIGKSSYDIEPIMDTGELLLCPGFVDEHIHGAGGSDAMDGTNHSLATIAQTLVKEGTTSFLATTMTQSDENIRNALQTVANYDNQDGARCLGVHLEGPFISKKYIGAQPKEYIQKPSIAYFKELQKVANGKIKMVSLAVEEDEEGLVSYLKSQGVVASVGHSNATQNHVHANIYAGLSCVTHTFNAQSPVHHREIGVAGSALLYDELYTEVIADTIHVSVPALQLLIKNKPKDKLILITDAMRAKGTGEGISELGGQTVFVINGQARLADGTLAGSVLKMNDAVKNLVQKCGVDIATAIDYATYNPAQNLGLDDIGIIKVGARADFILLDETFNVVKTLIDGKQVYSKDC